MSIEASLIVDYGDEAAAGAGGVFLELDNAQNIDAAGEVKSQFSPGDTVYFLLHHSSAWVLSEMNSTSGTIYFINDPVTRTRAMQADFVREGSSQQSQYFSIFNLVKVVYGNDAAILLRDNNIIYAGDGVFPVTADMTFSTTFKLFKLVCPTPVLADDETYRIRIVAYMEPS